VTTSDHDDPKTDHLFKVTVQWFLAEEQAMITTIWQLMFVLANFIASLLAYGFYQIHGSEGITTRGLYTWQWMTLCISMISSIASGPAHFPLPRTSR